MEILIVLKNEDYPTEVKVKFEKIGQEEVIAESSCEEEFPELSYSYDDNKTKKIKYPLYLEDYYKIDDSSYENETKLSIKRTAEKSIEIKITSDDKKEKAKYPIDLE